MPRPHTTYLTTAMTGLVVVLTVIKAGNVVASKIVVSDIDPLSAVFYRSLLAVVFIVLLSCVTRRAPVAPWRLGPWGLLAVLLFATNFTIFYAGTALTDASRVVVIVNLQPLVVAVVAPLFFPAETVTGRKVVGLLIALAGVMCIVGRDALAGHGIRNGDLLVFVAMLLWATGTVVEKRVLERLPAERAAVSMVIWNLAAALCGLILWMLFSGWRPADSIGPAATYAMAFMVTLGTSMFIALRWVLQRAPVSLVTSFNFLLPVWGVLFSVLLLGETLTAELVVGMCFVAVGIVVVNRPTAKGIPAALPAAAPAD